MEKKKQSLDSIAEARRKRSYDYLTVYFYDVQLLR